MRASLARSGALWGSSPQSARGALGEAPSNYGCVPHMSSATNPAGIPTTSSAMLISRNRE